MSSLDINQLFSVKGLVAAVTGGTSGLGFMICKGLVANGARVYVIALPSEPIAEKVAQLNELGQSSSGTAFGIECDLTVKESIANVAKHIGQRETYLDILVSNAGIRRDPVVKCDVLSAPLLDLQASMWSSKHSDWADSFCVNTTAHYFLSVALMPLLAAASQRKLEDGRVGRSNGHGVIVITSSCASMHNATNVDLTSYATSKAATDHLVKLLASKFGRFYIRVVGINPGCEFRLPTHLETQANVDEFLVVPSKMNPIGEEGNMFSALFDKVPARRSGDEEDIAGAVLYLVSRAGAYVDGISLCVDGGRVLFANGQE